jgi:hypothetical protein
MEEAYKREGEIIKKGTKVTNKCDEKSGKGQA